MVIVRRKKTRGMLKIKKKKIFKAATKLGCDVDGDHLYYKGQYYFVHMRKDICIKEEMPHQLSKNWNMRRKLTFRLPISIAYIKSGGEKI